jgi:hypothetical protein
MHPWFVWIFWINPLCVFAELKVEKALAIARNMAVIERVVAKMTIQ